MDALFASALTRHPAHPADPRALLPVLLEGRDACSFAATRDACSFAATGMAGARQRLLCCLTCALPRVCLACVARCHAGHHMAAPVVDAGDGAAPPRPQLVHGYCLCGGCGAGCSALAAAGAAAAAADSPSDEQAYHVRCAMAALQLYLACGWLDGAGGGAQGLSRRLRDRSDEVGFVVVAELLAWARERIGAADGRALARGARPPPPLRLPATHQRATRLLLQSPFFRFLKLGSSRVKVCPRHPHASSVLALAAQHTPWLLGDDGGGGSGSRSGSGLGCELPALLGPHPLGPAPLDWVVDPWVLHVLHACRPVLAPPPPGAAGAAPAADTPAGLGLATPWVVTPARALLPGGEFVCFAQLSQDAATAHASAAAAPPPRPALLDEHSTLDAGGARASAAAAGAIEPPVGAGAGRALPRDHAAQWLDVVVAAAPAPAPAAARSVASAAGGALSSSHAQHAAAVGGGDHPPRRAAAHGGALPPPPAVPAAATSAAAPAAGAATAFSQRLQASMASVGFFARPADLYADAASRAAAGEGPSLTSGLRARAVAPPPRQPTPAAAAAAATAAVRARGADAEVAAAREDEEAAAAPTPYVLVRSPAQLAAEVGAFYARLAAAAADAGSGGGGGALSQAAVALKVFTARVPPATSSSSSSARRRSQHPPQPPATEAVAADARGGGGKRKRWAQRDGDDGSGGDGDDAGSTLLRLPPGKAPPPRYRVCLVALTLHHHDGGGGGGGGGGAAGGGARTLLIDLLAMAAATATVTPSGGDADDDDDGGGGGGGGHASLARLQPLQRLLLDPAVVKVTHAAGGAHDSEALWLAAEAGVYLVNVFDTHTALDELLLAALAALPQPHPPPGPAAALTSAFAAAQQPDLAALRVSPSLVCVAADTAAAAAATATATATAAPATVSAAVHFSGGSRGAAVSAALAAALPAAAAVARRLQPRAAAIDAVLGGVHASPPAPPLAAAAVACEQQLAVQDWLSRPLPVAVLHRVAQDSARSLQLADALWGALTAPPPPPSPSGSSGGGGGGGAPSDAVLATLVAVAAQQLLLRRAAPAAAAPSPFLAGDRALQAAHHSRGGGGGGDPSGPAPHPLHRACARSHLCCLRAPPFDLHHGGSMRLPIGAPPWYAACTLCGGHGHFHTQCAGAPDAGRAGPWV